MSATAEQKAACAEREVRQRRRVYPKLVARGSISQTFADREIATMEEIAADYRRQAEGERLI